MDTSAVNSAIALVQNVIKLGKKATNLQYEEALLVAREALFGQRELNLQLSEKNLELKQKVKELEATKELSEEVEFAGEGYWQKTKDGWHGPCCTACWIDHKKLFRLSRIQVGQMNWNCPSCKANYSYKVLDKHPEDPKSIKPKTAIA